MGYTFCLGVKVQTKKAKPAEADTCPDRSKDNNNSKFKAWLKLSVGKTTNRSTTGAVSVGVDTKSEAERVDGLDFSSLRITIARCTRILE
jgi:hypothetical protein